MRILIRTPLGRVALLEADENAENVVKSYRPHELNLTLIQRGLDWDYEDKWMREEGFVELAGGSSPKTKDGEVIIIDPDPELDEICRMILL